MQLGGETTVSLNAETVDAAAIRDAMTTAFSSISDVSVGDAVTHNGIRQWLVTFTNTSNADVPQLQLIADETGGNYKFIGARDLNLK